MNQPDSRLDHARLPDATHVSEPDDTMSNDTLTLGHHPTATEHHRQRWSLAIVTVLASIAALAMVGAQDHHEPGAVECAPHPAQHPGSR